mgnify:CR=1 FL=1
MKFRHGPAAVSDIETETMPLVFWEGFGSRQRHKSENLLFLFKTVVLSGDRKILFCLFGLIGTRTP